MANLNLELDVVDVDGLQIIDPAVIVRLARSDGGGASAWRVSLDGRPAVLQLDGAPAGSPLILRLTPSRYRDLAVVCTVQGNTVRTVEGRPLVAPRRPPEWEPVFTPWSALPTVFEGLRARLAKSPRFQLGRFTAAGTLTGADYDGVDRDDEPRTMAKQLLLNLWSRLGTERAPDSGGPWGERFGELFLATRERVIAQTDEACFTLVHKLSQRRRGRYHFTPVGDHKQNLEVPGVTDVTELASIKSDEDTANLQFTVARARIDGKPGYVVDCDIDENGRLLVHAVDLVKHAFTGGTHPIDVHEALRVMFPDVPTGYGLEPRAPLARVDARIIGIAEPAAN